MTKRLSSAEVYDAAAFWAARMDAGPLLPEEERTLEAWIEADVRHYGALAQASALLLPMHGPMRDTRAQGPGRRRFLLGTGIAAGLTIAVGGAAYLARFGVDHYRTQMGEMRVIPLSDGSVVFLNTNTEMYVRYTQAQRLIELVRGEALFDVAKNRKRPFIVQSGGAQIRAVGTSFNVKALPDQPVQVLVREGIVEVKRPGIPVAPPVMVTKNSRVIAPQDAPIVAKPVETADIGRELAWRVGRIAFHGESLSDAAAEFARYSDVRIQIDDPLIARRKVTGLFVSTDPIGFANAVAVSFDLHAEISDGQVRLVHQ